ncbi:MAG: hypothetical protein K0S23_2644 [Fluviicola sp.]|jgi:hypothetical protein|nr:hypothetical protein [Fluviicola sp.]
MVALCSGIQGMGEELKGIHTRLSSFLTNLKTNERQVSPTLVYISFQANCLFQNDFFADLFIV